MSSNREDKQEVRIWGVLIKVGDKISFLNVEYLKRHNPELEKSIRYMVGVIGSGPFDLLGIKYYPRNSNSYWMFRFLDRDGEETEATYEYFTKYKEVSFRLIPCKEGCEECAENDRKFQKLVGSLRSMHISSSSYAGTLWRAPLRDFDRDHPEYDQCLRMQWKLFNLANRQKLS